MTDIRLTSVVRAALFCSAALAASMTAPASAIADDVVAAARASGVIGEQASGVQAGLLGVRDEAAASEDLRRRLNEINGERRAVYFERARQRGVNPAEMAAATACQLLATRVNIGEWYRGEDGEWRQHTQSAPVVMPSYCPP